MAILVATAAAAGCGAPLSPEHKAAAIKIQDLGGKINYEDGGYRVDLAGTEIGNRDLEHLKHISNLKELDVRGTRITDDAVEYLTALGSLRYIRIERSGMTLEGVQKLKKARPNLDVRR